MATCDRVHDNGTEYEMVEPLNKISPADTLPEPGAAERERSRELCALIAETCAQSGGLIAFNEFMRLALYAPGLGYYSGGLQKFGEAGDFITAPEVSPLFARCLARQAVDVLVTQPQPIVLEFGAGSGVMAADMLLELERLDALPTSYLILELAAELRQRQRETIQRIAPRLLPRVRWLDSLPASFSGVIVANEVLDAMPVECFRINEGRVESLMIGTEGGRLHAQYLPAPQPVERAVRLIEQRCGQPLPNGYCSEYNPQIPAWLQSIAAAMPSGVVLLIDYGYSAGEYYHEQRSNGTLMCHYHHRAHPDALWYPGVQDITAFVDFSAVAHAAVEVGFDVSGYTTQAMFLLASGLPALHQEVPTDDAVQQLQLAQQIKTLTLPSEMGERFKVMALSRSIDVALRGFSMQDYRTRL
jgi:SAM-dependent MidA family methyltransferase